ncbi:hypothetical protein D3C73_1071940 [compost metagenome]
MAIHICKAPGREECAHDLVAYSTGCNHCITASRTQLGREISGIIVGKIQPGRRSLLTIQRSCRTDCVLCWYVQRGSVGIIAAHHCAQADIHKSSDGLKPLRLKLLLKRCKGSGRDLFQPQYKRNVFAV